MLDCHLTFSPPPPSFPPHSDLEPLLFPLRLRVILPLCLISRPRFGVSKVSSILSSRYATFIVHISNARTVQWAILFPCLGVQRTASTNCTTNQFAASWTLPFSTTTTTSGDVAYQCFNHISGVLHLDDSNLDLNLGDVTLSLTTRQLNRTAKVGIYHQRRLLPSAHHRLRENRRRLL